MSEYQAQNARLEGLKQRAKLYQQQLLTQMNEQSEAALTAYTHDDGLFSEVVLLLGHSIVLNDVTLENGLALKNRMKVGQRGDHE